MPLAIILPSILNIVLSNAAVGIMTYLQTNDWKAGVSAALGSFINHARQQPSLVATATEATKG